MCPLQNNTCVFATYIVLSCICLSMSPLPGAGLHQTLRSLQFTVYGVSHMCASTACLILMCVVQCLLSRCWVAANTEELTVHSVRCISHVCASTACLILMCVVQCLLSRCWVAANTEELADQCTVYLTCVCFYGLSYPHVRRSMSPFQVLGCSKY